MLTTTLAVQIQLMVLYMEVSGKTSVTYSIPTAVLQNILIITHCVALALTL